MRPRAAWIRSPFVLVRYPGLLLAIAGAGVILAAAAAASPVFVSSAGNATLRKGLDPLCPWGVGLRADTYFFPYDDQGRPTGVVPSDWFGGTDREIRSRVRGLALGGDVVTVYLVGRSQAYAAGRPRRVAPVQLIARDGATEHVERLGSADVPGGVWITDTTANALAVRPGDRIALRLPGKPVVRVAGVYRDLALAPVPSWWCSMVGNIIPQNAFATSPPPPPPIILMDRSAILRLADRLRRFGEFGPTVTWEFPLGEPAPTLEDARPLSSRLDAIADGLATRSSGLGGCGPFGCTSGHTDLPSIVERAERTVESLRGPVAAVSWSGRLVAFALLAGAAGFWLARRRNEVTLLTARGVGPAGTARVVLMECFLPMLGAAILGWGIALWGIRALGPSSLIDRVASSGGLMTALWMGLAGLVLLSVAVAMVAHRTLQADVAPHRNPLRRVPWDGVVAALAGASLYELLTRGTGPVKSTSGKLELDVLVLLFPLLFVAAGTGLVTRALGLIVPRLARGMRGGPPAVYLAARRLAASGPLAAGLVVAAALGVGVLSYSGILGSSLTATERAKAAVFTGSDLSASVSEEASIPPSLADRATHVKVIPFSTFLGSGRMETLAIDPKTFDRAAFWDRSFADRPLRSLLDAMQAPRTDGRIPVLVVGAFPPTTGQILIGYGLAGLQDARVVGLAKAFPGSKPNRPLLVVPLDAPGVDDAPGSDQFWIRGDADASERALRAAGVPVFFSVPADQVLETADLASLAWAFGFLLALGIATALVAVVGAVLYLQARQRGRVVAHELARRMGMSRTSVRLPVVLELGGLLAVGLLLGLGLGWGAAKLVVGRLDPVPYLLPGMLFRTPLTMWLAVAGITPVLAWLGAWAAQLAADRTNMAEALRTSV